MDWNTSVTGAEGFNIAGTATSGKKVADIDDFLRDLAQTIRVRLDGILSWNNSTEQALSLKQTESRVSVYASTVMSVANAVYTTITFDVEDFDNLSEFTNSTFTAKAAGYYHACGQVTYQSIGDGIAVLSVIAKNGTQEANSGLYVGAAGHQRIPVAKLIYISVNDIIQLWGYHSHGSARDINPGRQFTYLTVHRIS